MLFDLSIASLFPAALPPIVRAATSAVITTVIAKLVIFIPDEIIKNCGVEKMKTLIKEAENKVEFILRHKRNKYDLATDDGKIQYIKEAIKVISGLSEIELEIYASRLADEFSVSKEVIIFEAKN